MQIKKNKIYHLKMMNQKAADPTCSCDFVHWARDAHFLLILANSGVNPFVYAWQFENFRKAIIFLLSKVKCSGHSRRGRFAPDSNSLTMETKISSQSK